MIDVLCTDISRMRHEVYEALLNRASAERRARAKRYISSSDGQRCIVAEALLRYAAARCGISEFIVEKGECGKPRLKGRTNFCYNLSHSGRWVVIAFGGGEVGVDVERLNMDKGKEALARRYFSESEQEQIFAETDAVRRGECFFRIWTQKESILKYLGIGFSGGIPEKSVEEMAAEWNVKMESRRMEDGYYLSVCARDTEFRIQTIDVERL